MLCFVNDLFAVGRSQPSLGYEALDARPNQLHVIGVTAIQAPQLCCVEWELVAVEETDEGSRFRAHPSCGGNVDVRCADAARGISKLVYEKGFVRRLRCRAGRELQGSCMRSSPPEAYPVIEIRPSRIKHVAIGKITRRHAFGRADLRLIVVQPAMRARRIFL